MHTLDHLNGGILRTRIADIPWVAMHEGVPQLLESYFCVTMAARGEATFATTLRPAIAELMAEPGWFERPGVAVVLSPSAGRARGWIERLVVSRGGRLKPIKGRQGFTVRIAKRKRRRLALLFIAMGAFVSLMREAGLHEGPNWLLIDGWDDWTEEEKARIRATSPGGGRGRGHRADVGRFFRFPFEVWIPVRTADVRWLEKLLALVRAAAKYAALELYVWIAGATGCRPGEPQWITFADLWEPRVGFGSRIMLRNKGDDGEAEKEAFIVRSIIDALARYVDGERFRLDPRRRDMEYWCRRGWQADGGDHAATAEMEGVFVLLNSRGERLTYKLVWYHVDTLFDATRTNPMSLHWLRHEYVFIEMRQIERIADPALQALRRAQLCAYMGWQSGEAMLECYDAFNMRSTIRLARIAFGEAREEAARANMEPCDKDVDEALTLTPMLAAIAAVVG